MNTEQLYQERLNRYVTAMRNEKPDAILRPFVAESTARYAGFTCQEVVHDYSKVSEAAIKTAKDFPVGRRGGQHGLCVDGLTQAAGSVLR